MNNVQRAKSLLGQYWFALSLLAVLLVAGLVAAGASAQIGAPISQQIGYYLYLPLTYN